ncbi:hypothetical protein VC83_05796 [Pseudogymnoascus destructans]|uniref:cellulose 1,4-beta-cellobiosidase (non-reducing end) n=2 Tax=Pseudogymnoascus destructans TaxID=655981 RepID=L8FWQ0_PSED2|nr:uncharacterized protein VC83_05796 [Pseudogymnoascus destructans]ELR05380.1 hypothetical protein GMDG_07363 [Pseudogymnoascus destructans 20631-21]OAF57002.1 hypothetical protein VC83_05796 [Pseudogymnoascus destructans]
MDFYQPIVPDEPIAPLNFEGSKAEIEEPFPIGLLGIFFPKPVLDPEAMASSIKQPYPPVEKESPGRHQPSDHLTIMYTKAILLSLIAAASSQQVGTEQAETHPTMTWAKCTGIGGSSCASQSGMCSTRTGMGPQDNESCAKNCALEGGDYPGTYGVNVSGNSNKLTFVTEGQYATNIGS